MDIESRLSAEVSTAVEEFASKACQLIEVSLGEDIFKRVMSNQDRF
jgi:hypothetical protein